jgi:hypothetical protein
VIELPAWSGYSSATKEQKISWDAMYKALQAHENRHHDIQLECVEVRISDHRDRPFRHRDRRIRERDRSFR